MYRTLLKNIKIGLYTKKYEQQVIDIYKKSYFPHEAFSIASGVSKNENTWNELADGCLDILKDGVTFVAIDTEKDLVIGSMLNKIQRADEGISYVKYKENCKSIEAKIFMEMMQIEMERADVFKRYKTDTLFEIALLGVLPEYRRQRIGHQLIGDSINYARRLSVERPNEKPPGGFVSVTTSHYSNKILKDQGFDVLHTEPYDSFEVRGRKYTGTEFTLCRVMGQAIPKQ